MTLDVYRGRKTTMQQQQPPFTSSTALCTADFSAYTMPNLMFSFLNVHSLSDRIYVLN